MRYLLILYLALSLDAAITNVTVNGVTSRQASISYSVAGTIPCPVEVSESLVYSQLIPDVDETKYAGAGHDSRSGSLGPQAIDGYPGSQRTFIAGTISAPRSASGFRYGRSLATSTTYYFRINQDSSCDADGPVAGTFVTAPVSLGSTYADPPLAEPGGIFAFPWIPPDGTAATDPQTGLKIRYVYRPGGAPTAYYGKTAALGAPYDAGGRWRLSGGGFPATFSSSNQEKLFVPFPVLAGIPGSYFLFGNGELSYARLNLTGSGAGAIPADRQLDVCIGFSNGTCATGTITQTMQSRHWTVSFGDTNAGLAVWVTSTGDITFDYQMLNPRAGAFTVAGNSINGGPFLPQQWTNGTLVQLTGAGCPASTTVAAAATNSDSNLTLSASLSGCSSGTYTIPGLGFLIAKHTNSTDQISIQSASFDWAADYNAQWASSAMQHAAGDVYCGGPGIGTNNLGHLCEVGALQFAIVYPDGTSTYMGGWRCSVAGGGGCLPNSGVGFAFDPVNPGVVYTVAKNPKGDTYDVLKLTYNGSFTNPGIALGQGVPVCGSPPCVTVATVASDTDAALRSFDPTFAQFCCGTPALQAGNPDGTLLFLGWESGQDTFGWWAVYDPIGTYNGGTPGFIASRASWRGYPSRWYSIHSYIDAGGGNYFATGSAGGVGWTGPLSGNSSAANGPYRVQVTGGINPGLMQVACPTRPVNSAIPAALWPGGSLAPGDGGTPTCLQFTIAGEPADPSPWIVTDGNATVGGGTNVTFSIATYRGFVGKPLTINGNAATIVSVDPVAKTAVISPAVTNGSGQKAVIALEPPCPAGVCAEAGHYKQDLEAGDVMFVGFPTTGVAPCNGGNQYGYFQYHYAAALCATSELYLVLSKTGRGPGATVTVMAGYPGVHSGYSPPTVSAWPGVTYLYLDSPLFNDVLNSTGIGYGSFWDYHNSPLGLSQNDIVDFAAAQGHQFVGTGINAGVYVLPRGFCAAGGITYPNWSGQPDTDCYGTRMGGNFAYLNQPIVVQSYNGPFHGVSGDGTPNSGVDSHPNAALGSTTFTDGRPLSGGGALSGCTRLSGTLYKCTAANRHCPSGAACAANDKILPVGGACGNRSLSNVSGPGVTIGGTSADAYKFVLAYKPGEGDSSTAVGDLVANCPGASVTGSSSGNAQDVVDINIWYNGPGTMSNTQTVSAMASPNGEATRWLGHGGIRPKQAYNYWNNRMLDNVLFWYAPTVNGLHTSVLASPLPPIVTDAVNRHDFVLIGIPIPQNSGRQLRARIRFGYAENGPPGSYYCTARAEACVTDRNVAPFAYVTSDDPSSPTDCSGENGCTVAVPAISGRILYYAVDCLTTGGALVSTGMMQAVTVP